MTPQLQHKPDKQACQWLPNLQVYCYSGTVNGVITHVGFNDAIYIVLLRGVRTISMILPQNRPADTSNHWLGLGEDTKTRDGRYQHRGTSMASARHAAGA